MWCNPTSQHPHRWPLAHFADVLAEVLYTVGVWMESASTTSLAPMPFSTTINGACGNGRTARSGCSAQALGVDLPAPVGGGRMRVLDTQHGVARGYALRSGPELGHGHIVAAETKSQPAFRSSSILGQHFHVRCRIDILRIRRGTRWNMPIGIERSFPDSLPGSQLIIEVRRCGHRW